MTNQEALTLLLSLAAIVNLFIVTHIGAYFIGRLIGKVLVCAVGTDIEIEKPGGGSWIVHMKGSELWSLMNKIEFAQYHAKNKALRDIEGDL